MSTALTLGQHGPGWWVILPIFWITAGVVFVTLVVRGRRGWWARKSRCSSEAVLGERYARGEVTDTEYRERLSVLRETR